MKPLIDGDILRYEIGFSGQLTKKDEDGNREVEILSFDKVAEFLNDKIELICDEVGATEAPTLYLTGDKYLFEKHLKKDYVPNFREEVATLKKYKGTRKQEKPFHFYNITEYMLAMYDCIIAEGMEADDLMCIEQYKRLGNDGWVPQTIICSRDKDLRICPGWHYSWECGRQASIGPVYTDEIGWLEKKPNGKILGYGLSLFFFQCLAGDAVDNIPGLPKYGPAKAFKLLSELKTEQEMFDLVRRHYEEVYNDDWKQRLKEQINLLWICQEMVDEKPIMYNPKERGLL